MPVYSNNFCEERERECTEGIIRTGVLLPSKKSLYVCTNNYLERGGGGGKISGPLSSLHFLSVQHHVHIRASPPVQHGTHQK